VPLPGSSADGMVDWCIRTMWGALSLGDHPGMTTPSVPVTPSTPTPPFSRTLRVTAGICLALAGLLNGGAQYIGHLVSGDPEDYIRWGAEHPEWLRAEQLATLISLLVLPLGLLGIAHVARWSAPRLTGIATVLLLWGMWGFHNVLALWYAAGSIAPGPLGVDAAVRLNESYAKDPGVLVTALLPHLVGSFWGLLLLCWAARRAFPKPALGLLAAFLIWDFLGTPVGPLEAHLLLAVSLVWLGVHLARLPQRTWSLGPPAPVAGDSDRAFQRATGDPVILDL
jgi:hypothetical protein